MRLPRFARNDTLIFDVVNKGVTQLLVNKKGLESLFIREMMIFI